MQHAWSTHARASVALHTCQGDGEHGQPVRFRAMHNESYTQRRAQLNDVIADALREAEETGDNDAAYQQATWLTDTFGSATVAAGRVRGAIARRIRDAEGLSLAQLGQRLGVARGTAQPIIRATRATRPEPKPVAA